jgi:hypothetical protein
MKRFLPAAALAIAAASVPALAADVGVSISVGDPGFYGRIDIGDSPQPRLLYRQPRVIYREAAREPIYLHVPPGQARHWRKYCRQYDACGERVYFVQDNWYNHVYVPHYRERHHDRRDEHGNDHRRDQNDHRGNDHRGNQNDHRGNDRDQGHGHGH